MLVQNHTEATRAGILLQPLVPPAAASITLGANCVYFSSRIAGLRTIPERSVGLQREWAVGGVCLRDGVVWEGLSEEVAFELKS